MAAEGTRDERRSRPSVDALLKSGRVSGVIQHGWKVHHLERPICHMKTSINICHSFSGFPRSFLLVWLSVFCNKTLINIWLVVWTPLKNISQLEWLFPIYRKKHVPNHQPEMIFANMRLAFWSSWTITQEVSWSIRNVGHEWGEHHLCVGEWSKELRLGLWPPVRMWAGYQHSLLSGVV